MCHDGFSGALLCTDTASFTLVIEDRCVEILNAYSLCRTVLLAELTADAGHRTILHCYRSLIL